jgi:3-dehydroquinate synthase
MSTIIETYSYEIFAGQDVLPELKKFIEAKSFSKVFILVDENSRKFCLSSLVPELLDISEQNIIEIKSGEENKNIQTCSQIWEHLSKNKADRNSLLVNFGGGVIGDMGGFAASTYKRGISFVNIPTTLLAQVDASVGGKLGIDFNNLKNEVGLFADPKEIYINPGFLKTLDKRQLLSGYAEIVKHALIADIQYWHTIKNVNVFLEDKWQVLIEKSVRIKNKIVMHDPFEKNLRKSLNFGHTIGHAIESYSILNDKVPLLHGEAIAIGMICETFLSCRVNGFSEEELMEVSSFIISVFDKYDLKPESLKEIVGFMYHDKKNQDNIINFTFLNKIGSAEINKTCPESEIYEALHYYRNLEK